MEDILDMTTLQQRQELVRTLKARLSATKVSQEKLAHMMGTTGQTVYRILNGKVNPPYDTLYKIDEKITELEKNIESKNENQKNKNNLVASRNERLAHIDKIREF